MCFLVRVLRASGLKQAVWAAVLGAQRHRRTEARNGRAGEAGDMPRGPAGWAVSKDPKDPSRLRLQTPDPIASILQILPES